MCAAPVSTCVLLVSSSVHGPTGAVFMVQVNDTATGQYYFKVDMAIVLDFTGKSSSASSWLGDFGHVGGKMARADIEQFVSSEASLQA